MEVSSQLHDLTPLARGCVENYFEELTFVCIKYDAMLGTESKKMEQIYEI
jgi:hypothetical protein